MKHLQLAIMMLAVPALAWAQLPMPSGLTATADNDGMGDNVILSWIAPEVPSALPTVEGFESYEAYAISGIGDWKMIDVDGKETNVWYNGKDYNYAVAHYAEPYSWIVMSNEGFTRPNYTDCEGTKILATFGAFGDAENWVISPKLNGAAQTVSFKGLPMPASASSAGATESLTVFYSTTDTEKESFTELKTISVDANTWTKYSFDLPEGALYFALRYTYSYGVGSPCYGVGIDEVTYYADGTMPLELLGYNIYRDGAKINDDVVTTTTYTDLAASSESHTYSISAIYASGESEKCADVEFEAVFKGPWGNTPANLTGELSGRDLLLSWEAPAIEQPEGIVESFEKYESYAIDNIGKWTMVDADELESNGWYNVLNYDYELMDKVGYSKKYAWMVMSNELFTRPNFTTVDGDKILATFSTFGGNADNWAISPKLNGLAQTVTFKAVSLDKTTVEKVSVYASTTGTEVADFTLVKECDNINDAWNEISFDLPEGTLYFAFRYQSEYGTGNYFGVGIDQVAFKDENAKPLELLGYNVYSGENKLNSDVVSNTNYTVANMGREEAAYHVTAVYDKGESAASEVYNHTYTGTWGNAPTALTGQEVNNDLVLTWTAPVIDEADAAAPASLALVGYDVYRNGTKLNTEPAAEATYTVLGGAAEDADYYVIAVYNRGESEASEVYHFKSSGIDAIDAEAGEVEVFNLQGMRVGKSLKNLPAGIYVVSGKKVIVR